MSNSFASFASALAETTRWKLALALALMILVGLTEGIGLLLLVPLLELIGLDVERGGVGVIAGFFSSFFSSLGLRPSLPAVLGVYVVIFSANALLYRWQATASADLLQTFVNRLRARLYRAIANTWWLFFSRNRSSDFTHALTTEIDRVGVATNYLLQLAVHLILAVVYVSLALRLSGLATGLVMAGGGVLLVLLREKTRPARITGEELTLATKGLYAAAIEHFAGMKTAKSYGAEERNAAIFSAVAKRVAQTYLKTNRSYAEVKCWFDIGSVLILSTILVLLIEIVDVPPAGVLLSLFLFARVMPRLSGILQSYQQLANALPAFANVREMEMSCRASAEHLPAQSERVDLRVSVRLEGVRFAYDSDANAFAISDLDLTITAGEITAIVGPSGAGKSTVADIVMGLIVPDSGRLLVDDTPLIAGHMRAWREQIGYVAQDTFLFNDTVRANLLWACPAVSLEDIRSSLRSAAAEEFVSGLPHGIETILGDRGVCLSGGERQRLALARALLRKPSLLILDEATSNLDSENENRILEAIHSLRGQMTILIITHRLSTIRGASIIYVLDGGQLVESGSWSELMGHENGRFRELCRAQGIEAVPAGAHGSSRE